MPPIDHQYLPASLLERFAGDGADRLVALLRFIGPSSEAADTLDSGLPTSAQDARRQHIAVASTLGAL
jgi:hypothetical protein